MKTRFYVEVCEYAYGCAGVRRYYAPETGKTLKKLWKHICKEYFMNPNVSYITAIVETDDGCIEDVGQYWNLEYMEHLCEIGAIPFC